MLVFTRSQKDLKSENSREREVFSVNAPQTQPQVQQGWWDSFVDSLAGKELLVLALIIGAIAFVSYQVASATWWWAGLALFVGATGSLVINSLDQISADPPENAVVVIFGRRVKRNGSAVVKKEGLRVFPLQPFLYAAIHIPMTRQPFDFPQQLRTPDRALSGVPVLVVFRLIDKHSHAFIESGGLLGVKKILAIRIMERLREWAMAGQEGPMTWRELQKAQFEAMNAVLRAISRGIGITQIPEEIQSVPTFILLRYFAKPRQDNPDVLFENERPWQKDDWKKVKDALETGARDANTTVEDFTEKVKQAVEARRREIQDFRTGKANLLVEDLGVTIESINVGEVELLGKAAEVADREAVEKEEREAEILELEHVRKRIEEFMQDPLNFDAESAAELVLVERGKLPKTTSEGKLSIAAATRELLKTVAPDLLAAVLKKGGPSA